MKIKINLKVPLRIQALWLALTEVPGWPDAPGHLRIRRAAPIFAPAIALLLFAAWHFGWSAPHIARQRAAHAPLIALSNEVENLRAFTTEEAAAELAASAEKAGKRLLDTPTALETELPQLQQLAAQHGWEAKLQPVPVPPEAGRTAEPIYFVTARAKLTARKGNAQPFPSLVALIEELSAWPKRIELTRLTVRADEGGRHSVEFNLRLSCRTHP